MPPKKHLNDRQQTISKGLRDLGISDASAFGACGDDRNEEFTIVKKQYHKQVLAHHPDKGGDAALFRNVQTSWELLKDLHTGKQPRKRGKSQAWLFSDVLLATANSAAAASGNGDTTEEEAFDMSDYDFDFSKMDTPSWEFYYEAAAEEMPPYRVELAKSGRSKCSSSLKQKKCTEGLSTAAAAEEDDCTDLVAVGAEPELIAKNEVRMGWLNDQSGGYGGWRHLRCWRVPHKIWLGLPDPKLFTDPAVFTAALTRMDQTLLSGFADIPRSDQRALVDFCMDRSNWARLKKKKMLAAAAPDAPSSSSSSAINLDVKPEALHSSAPGAAGLASVPSSTTTLAVAPPAREKFIIPKPGQNGASGANVFAGKTFVLTGVFPELGGGGGLSLGKERVKALIQSFGGRVTGSISGKTDVLLVGKDPGMSKCTQARARSKVLVACLKDLKLGLDGGCNALEEFQVSRDEPMVIQGGFSKGYQMQATKEYNGLSLQASKQDLAIARGLKRHAANEIEATKEAPMLTVGGGDQKPAAVPSSTNDVDAKPAKKRKTATKKKKAPSPIAADDEAPDNITCDLCDADCTEESWFLGAKEEDICKVCYKNDKKSMEGAVFQRNGETVLTLKSE